MTATERLIEACENAAKCLDDDPEWWREATALFVDDKHERANNKDDVRRLMAANIRDIIDLVQAQ